MEQENFKTTPPVSLSSNVVKPQVSGDYSVFNKKGAIVGTVLNNGFTLRSEISLKNFNICFTLLVKNQIHNDYVDFDVGSRDPDDEIHLIPQGANIFKTETGFYATVPELKSGDSSTLR